MNATLMERGWYIKFLCSPIADKPMEIRISGCPLTLAPAALAATRRFFADLEVDRALEALKGEVQVDNPNHYAAERIEAAERWLFDEFDVSSDSLQHAYYEQTGNL